MLAIEQVQGASYCSLVWFAQLIVGYFLDWSFLGCAIDRDDALALSLIRVTGPVTGYLQLPSPGAPTEGGGQLAMMEDGRMDEVDIASPTPANLASCRNMHAGPVRFDGDARRDRHRKDEGNCTPDRARRQARR